MTDEAIEKKSRLPTNEDRLREALNYAARGWHIVPASAKGKVPLLPDWQNLASTDESTIIDWWDQYTGCNVGVQLGEKSGIIDIECDTEQAEKDLLELFDGEIPDCPMFQATRGKHRIFQWCDQLPGGAKVEYGPGKLEIRMGNGGKGAQSIFPPSINIHGAAYTWLIHPDNCEPPPLPEAVLVKLFNRHGEVLNDAAKKRQYTGENQSDPRSVARWALGSLPSYLADGYESWIQVGMCLRSVGADMVGDWDFWSRASEKYTAGECSRKWTTFKPTGLGLGTLVKLAQDHGAIIPDYLRPAVVGPGIAEAEIAAGNAIKGIRDLGDATGLRMAQEWLEAWNAKQPEPQDLVSLQRLFKEALKQEEKIRAMAQIENVGLVPSVDNRIGSKAAGWTLKIIRSKPRKYHLTCPLWRGPVELDTAQIMECKAICKAVLEQLEEWVDPRKLAKAWLVIAKETVQMAEKEEVGMDDHVDRVLADYIYESLVGFLSKREKKDRPDGTGCPSELTDGRICFSIHWIMQRISSKVGQGEKFTRPQISNCLKKSGFTSGYVGGHKRRLWVGNEMSLEAMRQFAEGG